MRAIKHIYDKFARKSVEIIAILISLFFIGCESKSFEFYPFQFQTDSGIATYYCVKSYIGEDRNVVIPDTYEGNEVRYVLDEAFSYASIRSVDIGSVKQIYRGAFAGCNHLISIKLNQVERIYMGAFRNCARLKSITIPRSVNMIESGVFAGCDSLENVYFEGNPEQLSEDIFSDTRNITIYGPAGGTVEEYALSNNIDFKAWNVTW